VRCTKNSHLIGLRRNRTRFTNPVMTRQAYPRDLTDQKWSIIEPMLPPREAGRTPTFSQLT